MCRSFPKSSADEGLRCRWLFTSCPNHQWGSTRLKMGPLIFLIFVNDIPKYIVSNFYLFADDVKWICQSDDINALAEDLRKRLLRIESCDMHLSVDKCLHIHQIPRAPQKLFLVDSNRIVSDLPQVQTTKFARLILDVFIPAYAIFIRSSLECCVRT